MAAAAKNRGCNSCRQSIEHLACRCRSHQPFAAMQPRWLHAQPGRMKNHVVWSAPCTVAERVFVFTSDQAEPRAECAASTLARIVTEQTARGGIFAAAGRGRASSLGTPLARGTLPQCA